MIYPKIQVPSHLRERYLEQRVAEPLYNNYVEAKAACRRITKASGVARQETFAPSRPAEDQVEHAALLGNWVAVKGGKTLRRADVLGARKGHHDGHSHQAFVDKSSPNGGRLLRSLLPGGQPFQPAWRATEHASWCLAESERLTRKVESLEGMSKAPAGVARTVAKIGGAAVVIALSAGFFAINPFGWNLLLIGTVGAASIGVSAIIALTTPLYRKWVSKQAADRMEQGNQENEELRIVGAAKFAWHQRKAELLYKLAG